MGMGRKTFHHKEKHLTTKSTKDTKGSGGKISQKKLSPQSAQRAQRKPLSLKGYKSHHEGAKTRSFRRKRNFGQLY
jgi:hypothetical protein